MTKLCDLGPNDGVCSVQWTREGSYISIGTNYGQVQVFSFRFLWDIDLQITNMFLLVVAQFET